MATAVQAPPELTRNQKAALRTDARRKREQRLRRQTKEIVTNCQAELKSAQECMREELAPLIDASIKPEPRPEKYHGKPPTADTLFYWLCRVAESDADRIIEQRTRIRTGWERQMIETRIEALQAIDAAYVAALAECPPNSPKLYRSLQAIALDAAAKIRPAPSETPILGSPMLSAVGDDRRLAEARRRHTADYRALAITAESTLTSEDIADCMMTTGETVMRRRGKYYAVSGQHQAGQNLLFDQAK
ncbi:MAG: hypothetical protein C7B46_16510 [Sulfobacillus benefaciens]|uniref:Uncharacterized protein n=1 Tax=Sulfobacillus benefaciens TaxID=453960 RepID=A0A2T2XAV3_9FIRM|nr:MAG: hypothetical protein C7B46_16510 [Sulfobacillus benefaciens]